MNTDAEKRPRSGSEDRNHATDRRWKVLFIGDHGRVIAFKRLKILIGLALGTLASALGAVAVLVVVNQGLNTSTQELRQRLEASQQQIQALRQERDLLTAHVVLVETKMKEMLAAGQRPAAAQKPDPAGAGQSAERTGTSAPEAAGDKPAVRSAPVEDIKLPVGIGEGIGVEAFQVGFDAARKAIDLRYKLATTRQGSRPQSGHVIVVFKGDDLEPEQWLAMPRVELPKGRPTGRQKGFTFSISHSKAFSHSMAAPAWFPAFTRAVLYVFSAEGQLLMAKDYAVDLKPSGG
jgi:cell division protein FtsB